MATPRTPPTLASLIDTTLHTRPVCRVYSEDLSACWPDAMDSDTLTLAAGAPIAGGISGIWQNGGGGGV